MALRSTMATLIDRVRLLKLNVPPVVALADIKDSRCTNTKPLGNLAIANTLFMKLANFKYLLICQFRQVMCFTFRQIEARRVVVSVLSGAVSNIIGRSAKKKMLGIDTRWIVACMANKHAFGDGSTIKLIGYATGNTVFPMNFNGPVSLWPAFTTSPYPASIITAASIAMKKQSLFKWDALNHRLLLLNHVLSYKHRVSHIKRTVKEVG